MNIQKIITPFSKKDLSANIILGSKVVSFKSLDKEFQDILKKEFSDTITKYQNKEEIVTNSKIIS